MFRSREVGFKKEIIKALLCRVERMLDSSLVLKESMDDIHEWNTPAEIIVHIVDILDFIINLILVIELSTNEMIDSFFDIKSSEKLTVAVEIIDRIIILPWYLELVDGFIFRILISIVVSLMNKWFGNSWDMVIAKTVIYNGGDYIEQVKRSRRL